MNAIEELNKACSIAEKSAIGLLKKSQMAMDFGTHDHHVAYTRTNASGTVSNVAAKGAANSPYKKGDRVQAPKHGGKTGTVTKVEGSMVRVHHDDGSFQKYHKDHLAAGGEKQVTSKTVHTISKDKLKDVNHPAYKLGEEINDVWDVPDKDNITDDHVKTIADRFAKIGYTKADHIAAAKHHDDEAIWQQRKSERSMSDSAIYRHANKAQKHEVAAELHRRAAAASE